MTAARHIAIILLLAAAVAFVPGGGTTAALIGGILSTLILVAFVLLAARFYRERRLDLETLGDRWRGVFYGAIGLALLAMAAGPRLRATDGGTIAWVAMLGVAAYAVYLVWRHWREDG